MGYIFHFNHNGECRVYSFDDLKFISSFTLGGADIVVPHSNAVCFGNEYYEDGGEFPILYSNVYNNYQDKEERREGTLCAYRLKRSGNSFFADLIQEIKVDFLNDSELSRLRCM